METKDDGDVKIKIRFDDGTTENREYNLEYLKRYADYIINPEDWLLGEYNLRSIYFNRNYINVSIQQKRGLPRPRSVRKNTFANEFIFVAEGETSTSEVTDRFFHAPAPETQAEFQHRLQKRITHTARYLVAHTPALLPHFMTQSETFVEHEQLTTASVKFRNIIDGMKTYIGYCQKRLNEAEGYDIEVEALIHGLHDEFLDLHSNFPQSEFFMLDILLDGAVFDWAFAYNNKQIYKVNSDGSRGDLLLDIGGQDGIEPNAAASEYHTYATTHFTESLRTDIEHPGQERLALRIEEYKPDFRDARLSDLQVRLGQDIALSFTQEFSPDIFEYTISQGFSSNVVYSIIAVPNSSLATVSGDVGVITPDPNANNQYLITVASLDGLATQTYTINWNGQSN